MNNFPNIFHKVANRVKEYLIDFSYSIENNKIEKLISSYKKLPCSKINYDKFSMEFNYIYFLVNYWKGAKIAIDEATIVPKKILDLGSGSGAMALSYLSWIHHKIGASNSYVNIELILVDENVYQLNYAKKIFKLVEPLFTNIRCNITFQNCEVKDYLKNDNSFDIILLSHLLTENYKSVTDIFHELENLLDLRGEIIIVERIKDPVWYSIGEALRDLFLTSTIGSKKFNTENLPLISHELFSNIDALRTKYMILKNSSQISKKLLIKKYFDAWKGKSIKDVRRIFTKNAKYYNNLHNDPIVGIEGICEYWNNKVLPQIDPQPSLIRMIDWGDDIFIKWSSKFFLCNEQIHLKGYMIISIDITEGKICQLEECFTKKNN